MSVYLKSLNYLKLFNEKAKKLAGRKFSEFMFNQRTGVSVTSETGEKPIVQRRGPDEEIRDSFILTFRFFIQNREQISIKKVSEIYENLPISPEKRESFNLIINNLNNLLNGESILNVNDKFITKRHIMDVFIYGNAAHADEEKRKLFNQYMSVPIFNELFLNELDVILSKMLIFINRISELNENIIFELENINNNEIAENNS